MQRVRHLRLSLATAVARSLRLIWLRLTPSQFARLWRMSHRSHVFIQIPENGNVFFAGVYYTAFQYGATLAMLRFAFRLGLLDHSFRQAIKAQKAMRRYREKSGNHYLNRKVTIDFFLRQELLPVTNYLPDIETIKKNRVRVFMTAGKRSLEKKRLRTDRTNFSEEARVRADDFPRPPWFFYRYAR
jgi:hypothetical protein